MNELTYRTSAYLVCRVFDRRYLDGNIHHGFLQSFAPPHLKPAKRATASNSQSEDAEGELRRANEDEEVEEEVEGEDELQGSYIDMRAFRSRMSQQIQSLIYGLSTANGEQELSTRRRASFTELPRGRGEVRVNSRLDPLLDHQPSKYNITAAVYSAQGDGQFYSINMIMCDKG